MRLTYTQPQQERGKTSEDSDEIEVRLTKLEDGQRIEQEIIFESEDPVFDGIMRVIWAHRRGCKGMADPARLARRVEMHAQPDRNLPAPRSTLPTSLTAFASSRPRRSPKEGLPRLRGLRAETSGASCLRAFLAI
jgi:hypothetical protein